ncbi:MAG: thioesterase family protein [Gammaproteobacteria bacterium]|nr:thioesterase family protein [Gammaproteobacteria bacterium]
MAFLTIEPEIYTYDIDFNNHVSNISYIRWMEIGRLKLLESIGLPVHEIERQGFAPVLTRTEISYKKPLLLGDKIRVEVGISKLRKISGTLVFRFICCDEIVAEGEQDALFISVETRKVYKLTEDQRRRFEACLVKE